MLLHFLLQFRLPFIRVKVFHQLLKLTSSWVFPHTKNHHPPLSFSDSTTCKNNRWILNLRVVLAHWSVRTGKLFRFIFYPFVNISYSRLQCRLICEYGSMTIVFLNLQLALNDPTISRDHAAFLQLNNIAYYDKISVNLLQSILPPNITINFLSLIIKGCF